MSEDGSGAVTSCSVSLVGACAEASLVLTLLPKEPLADRALRIADDEETHRWGTERAQLLEGVEYRYALQGLDGAVVCGPEEVFTPDDASGRTGRLRPRLRVGRMELTVHQGVLALRGAVEVRARKV